MERGKLKRLSLWSLLRTLKSWMDVSHTSLYVYLRPHSHGYVDEPIPKQDNELPLDETLPDKLYFLMTLTKIWPNVE